MSEEWRGTGTFRRLVDMATSVVTSIRDQAGQVTGRAHFLPSKHLPCASNNHNRQARPVLETGQATGCTLIDVEIPLKDTTFPTSLLAHPSYFAPIVLLSVALTAALVPALTAQSIVATAAPPPSDGGVFPVSEVHAGMKATAWTVFKGTAPEPMDVEILGVMRNARGTTR